MAGGAILLTPLRAFDAGSAWPDGDIPIAIEMDVGDSVAAMPTNGLSDDSENWDAAVAPALEAWNAVPLVRSRLVGHASQTVTETLGDGINSMYFSDTASGQDFGDRTLAVTISRTTGAHQLRMVESDIIFKSSVQWDSYRGNLRSRVDVRRVALHELGHALGLLHPDEATPAQSVAAIMNSVVGNLDILQSDDIAGAVALYGAPLITPVITRQPASASVSVGGSARLDVGVNNGEAPPSGPLLQYSWFFTPAGGGATEFLFTYGEGNIPLGAAQLDDAGTYRVAIETPNGEVMSAPATISVAPVTLSSTTRLSNLSTRGITGTGDKPLIVGFVIEGTSPRRILIRAIGPGLSQFDIAGALADPELNVFQGDDDSETADELIASNDDWADDGQGDALAAAFKEVGAFGLDPNSKDAALVATLPAGRYTAVIDSKGLEGVALVEAYDLDRSAVPDSRMTNLSTRGFVGTGENMLIAGLSIEGPGPRTYILRAVGDTLQDLGVSGTIDDPVMSLFDDKSTLLRWTDDWDTPEFLQPKLIEAFRQVGAFDLTDRQECALRLTLLPGNYTLQVSGFEGGTGIGLVELYEE